MKKTFLTRRNALLTPGSLSWGSAAVALVLLLLVFRLVAPSTFYRLLAPLFGVSNAAGQWSHELISSFGDRAVLATANETLANENAALSVENQTLRQKIAALAAATTRLGVTADVLSRPPESPYDTLLVAAGSDVGVVTGQEAFTLVGTSGVAVPIGVVTTVTAHFARVTLFTAPQVHTDAWVGPHTTPITLTGTGGGTVFATVERAAGIAMGDTVSVPGPGALPIGQVVRVDSDPASPAVVLRIALISNPFSISRVLLRDGAASLQDSFTTP